MVSIDLKNAQFSVTIVQQDWFVSVGRVRSMSSSACPLAWSKQLCRNCNVGSTIQKKWNGKAILPQAPDVFTEIDAFLLE